MSLEARIHKDLGEFCLDVDIKATTETLGFLGASGCGKSLTLRCIAGIEKPDEGYIRVNDRVFYDSAAGIDLSPQERKTALLFQNYMLFPNLTIEQNVAAGIGRDVPREEAAVIVERELTRFSLGGFQKRYPAQLSGGQQQRVALARMLAAKPDILMLDEPFSALDSHLKGVLEQNLVDLFAAFKGTVLYVSHDIDEALRFCDRIAVVEAGRIRELDTGDELVNAPKSEAALKLSGCKNSVPFLRTADREVWIPRWGVAVHTADLVPFEEGYLGVRARYVEQVDGVGENCYRMRVDRVSDSRFDRSALLAFLDRSEEDMATVTREDDEMRFLHQHLFWRVDKLAVPEGELPQVGDELWIRLPQERIYIVSA